MSENLTLVFHGFLKLSNLEKLKMTEMINEYFDSNDRETIRRRHEENYLELKNKDSIKVCHCCEREKF